MIRHRSHLPLVLILALLVGVGWLSQRRQGPGVVENPPAVSSGSDHSARVEDGFGPIPTATAADEIHRPATLQGSPGVEESSAPLRNLAARMSRETEGLAVVTHADGRRSVALGGRFTHVSVAVKGVDGKTGIRCFSDYHEMTAALSGKNAPGVHNPEPHAR